MLGGQLKQAGGDVNSGVGLEVVLELPQETRTGEAAIMPAAQAELVEGIQPQGTRPELEQGFEGDLEAVEPGSSW